MNQYYVPNVFKFLDAQGFTPNDVEDLQYILDKIYDYECDYGEDFDEDEAIALGMEYQKYYRVTHS